LLDVFAFDSSVSVSDVRIDDAGLISDHRLVATKVSASVLARHTILSQGASKTSTRQNSSTYCASRLCSQRHPEDLEQG